MPEAEEPRDLGIHKGLPILSETVTLRKGARVFRDVSEITTFEVDDGQLGLASLMYRQAGEKFEVKMSTDEPDKVLGYERVLLIDVVAAAPDEREATRKELERMRARTADLAERKANEKKGQMRMPGIKPVPDDDPEAGSKANLPEGHMADDGKIREIRPGVPDDEGAGEKGGQS